jgi:MFS family permease
VSPAGPPDARAPRGTAIRLALAITFATSVASVSGVSLLYPALPVIARDLDVSESSIGLLIAAYTLPAIVLAPLFGMIADIHGRRWLLIIGLVIFALAGAAAALAPSFAWLIALRVVQGIGFSMITPLTIVLISDLLREDQELKAQGQKVVIDRVAMISLPILGGALAAVSWQWAFAPFLLVLLLAAAAWRWMPETRVPGVISPRSYLSETWRALGLPRIQLGLAVGFLRFFLDYGLFIYLPLLIGLRLGASAVTIGWVLAASAAGAIVTAASIGWVAARASPERLLALAFASCGLGLAAMGAQVDLVTITAAAFAFGLGNGLISPLQKSLLTRNAPPLLRGGVIAADRVIQQVAKSLAPGVIGLALLAVSLETVFIALGALGVVSAVALACAPGAGRT